MVERNMKWLISDAVDSVSETMFFSAPFGSSEQDMSNPCIKVRVAFRGCPSGTLEVCVSELSARALASSFLGEDEKTLTDSQASEVVCEMSNMLCGSLISRLESEQSFDLDSPRLVLKEEESDKDLTPAAHRQCFEIEGGLLTVSLHLLAAS